MVEKINSACLNNSISYNFIAQMLPHHAAAIEMSEELLEYSDNRELVCICKNIICEQKKSINDMLCIQEGSARFCSSGKCLAEYSCATQKILQNMFSKMRCAAETDCIECNFLREMIPHHEGAVCMSENLLKYDICPGLVPIARSIITNQKRGICEMKRLCRELKCL